MAIPCNSSLCSNESPDKTDSSKLVPPQTPTKSGIPFGSSGGTGSFPQRRTFSPNNAAENTNSSGTEEDLNVFDKNTFQVVNTTSPQSDLEHENDCIFVGNLPKRYTKIQLEKIVRQLFSSYGPVEYTKASMDKKGRPYCFVKFLNCPVPGEILAQEIVLDARVLRVEMAKGQPIKSIALGGNLGYPTGGSGGFGSPCSSHHQHQHQHHIPVSVGHGRNYLHESSEEMSHITNGISNLTMEQARNGTGAEDYLESNVIRVAGLSSIFVSEGLLLKYFEKYGAIANVCICSVPTRTSPGSSAQRLYEEHNGNGGCHSLQSEECIALIKFQDSLSARRAIFSEDGNIWLGNKIKVGFERNYSNASFPPLTHSSSSPISHRMNGSIGRTATPPNVIGARQNEYSHHSSNSFVPTNSTSSTAYNQGNFQSKRFPIGQYELPSVNNSFLHYPGETAYQLDHHVFSNALDKNDNLQVTLPSFSSLPPGLPSFSNSSFAISSDIQEPLCLESLGFDIPSSPVGQKSPLLCENLTNGFMKESSLSVPSIPISQNDGIEKMNLNH